MNKKLSCDVSSPASGVEYGKQGDEVIVISDNGPVCIVENKSGERFPVPTILLTDIGNETDWKIKTVTEEIKVDAPKFEIFEEPIKETVKEKAGKKQKKKPDPGLFG